MKKITVFETPDGKIHKEEEEAQKHMTDIFSEIVDKKMLNLLKDDDACDKHGLRRHQVIRFIDFLFGDYTRAKQLIEELSRAMD